MISRCAKAGFTGRSWRGLGTGTAIDLLPDREAATLQAWLKAHPGATVICRDRAGAYAEAARDGAPDAIQVADRWHLWHNLGEYAEKAVAAHRGCLARSHRTPAQDNPGPTAAGPGPPPAEPEALRDVCGRQRHLVARTRDRHAAVHGLLAAGHSQRDAAAILGLSRNTVNRFAAAASPDELLVKATSRETKPRPLQALPAPAAERRHHHRRGPARRAAGQRLERQRAGRRALCAAIPRDDHRAAPPTRHPQDPPDHPLAAEPPRPPPR
jgi:hypothetical protein